MEVRRNGWYLVQRRPEPMPFSLDALVASSSLVRSRARLAASSVLTMKAVGGLQRCYPAYLKD